MLKALQAWLAILATFVAWVGWSNLTAVQVHDELVSRQDVDNFNESIMAVAERPPYKSIFLKDRVNFNVIVDAPALVEQDLNPDHERGSRENPWFSVRTEECPNAPGDSAILRY
jgi:hypothetical protein